MSTTATLAAGVLVVVALPLVWRGVRGRLDLFEPVVIFALAWGVMFAVRRLRWFVKKSQACRFRLQRKS